MMEKTQTHIMIMLIDYVDLTVQDSHHNIQNLDELLKDVDEELWPGCKKYSKLSFILVFTM